MIFAKENINFNKIKKKIVSIKNFHFSNKKYTKNKSIITGLS